jgi:glutathione synthase/RimK-type ligase-like ATP-grasp enzyme
MRGANIACPETVTVYDRKGRGSGVPVLKSIEELKSFLKTAKNYPLFAKPMTGLLSIGAFRIDESKGDMLSINGGSQMHVDEVCDYMHKISKKGYLFQKVINVDCGSGKIDRAVEKNEHHVAEVKQGEALYKSLIGFQLPDFEDAKNVVILAAKQLPGIKVQSWDVAFSDKGPVMLEVNYGGDLNLTQMASLKGVMTKDYRALIDK